MNWLNGLVKKTPEKSKRSSKTKKSAVKTRFFVKSDNKIVTAYKKEDGPGYVYRKRTPSGLRSIPVHGITYKTEEQAKKKAQSKK